MADNRSNFELRSENYREPVGEALNTPGQWMLEMIRASFDRHEEECKRGIRTLIKKRERQRRAEEKGINTDEEDIPGSSMFDSEDGEARLDEERDNEESESNKSEEDESEEDKGEEDKSEEDKPSQTSGNPGPGFDTEISDSIQDHKGFLPGDCAGWEDGTHNPYHPETTGLQFQTFLTAVQTNFNPYTHPNVIFWTTGTKKENWKQWMTTEDHQCRQTVSAFTRRRWGKVKTAIALFSCESENWVGLPKAKQEEIAWHTWTVCIATAGRGQIHMIIYDVDPPEAWTERPAYVADLHWVQRLTVRELRQKSRNMRVWCWNDRTDSGKGICTMFAVGKLKEVARVGDVPFQGLDDTRVAKCVLLED